MRLRIPPILLLVAIAQCAWGQTNESPLVTGGETAASPSADGYAVLGATPRQETLIRVQVRAMRPDVYPLRVLFVPHWKYVEAARTFRLRVPAGYTSVMFTHLPSRSVFIDTDKCASDDFAGYWVAHELGHLAANNTKEADAEKAARRYRKRLKQARIEAPRILGNLCTHAQDFAARTGQEINGNAESARIQDRFLFASKFR